MVKCPSCGSDVEGSAFCYNCGQRINHSVDSSKNNCPNCGAENPKNTSFCKKCGQSLSVNAPKTLSQTEWERKRDEVLERYDKLAEEFGIKDEDYFLTTVHRYNKLEKTTGKFTKNKPGAISILEGGGNLSLSRVWGNETMINGFFIIKPDKFVLMEIDNRNFEKVNAGVNNFYFDKIVSMRVTKSVGDNESKYADITKRTWVSNPTEITTAIRTDIDKLKSFRFKDMIANNDSADMFDRLLIKLVDNTSYEIRVPSFEFGNKLVELYELLRNKP